MLRPRPRADPFLVRACARRASRPDGHHAVDARPSIQRWTPTEPTDSASQVHGSRRTYDAPGPSALRSPATATAGAAPPVPARPQGRLGRRHHRRGQVDGRASVSPRPSRPPSLPASPRPRRRPSRPASQRPDRRPSRRTSPLRRRRRADTEPRPRPDRAGYPPFSLPPDASEPADVDEAVHREACL